MYQKITKTVAGANRSSAMETETIQKNGTSPKSQRVGFNFQKLATAVILLCLCSFATTAVAQTSGTTGNCTWSLTGEGNNLTLTISGTGAMADYLTASDAPWFSNRAYIKTLVINEGVTSIGEAAFIGCEGLTSVSIPNSVTSIGAGAFSACYSLTSVSIPNSVTSIGASAFSSCSGLTSVSIPNSVTSIGWSTFWCCDGLTSVDIPNSVTSISESAFQGCSKLTSVSIPNSVTSIGSYAFSSCIGLTSVDIPNSVTSIGSYAFSYCSKLTSVSIGNSVTSIGAGAFHGCYGLTSVSIPNSVTSIGEDTFWYCYGLTSVSIPNSITTIGSNAFYGCSGLTSVSIPNSVTSIGAGAFYDCSGLTSVSIPNSVTSIGSYAFQGCNGLTDVTVYWAMPLAIGSSVFYDVTASNVTLHVPTGTKAAYQAASVWKDFGNIIDDAPSGIQDVSVQPLQVSVSGGELSISCESPVRRVEIYNLSGSLVVSESNFAGKINVASLPAGVYVVRAGNYTAKFVKE